MDVLFDDEMFSSFLMLVETIRNNRTFLEQFLEQASSIGRRKLLQIDIGKTSRAQARLSETSSINFVKFASSVLLLRIEILFS